MAFGFTDHSREVLEALTTQKEAALEAIGQAAEGFAKANLTQFPRVDTGRLRNSVSHTTDEDNAYVGTNVEYAPYVEFGTGPYAEDANGSRSGGRSDVPWFYKDEKGQGHLSYGMAASHFLKKSVSDHGDQYRQIVMKYLKG